MDDNFDKDLAVTSSYAYNLPKELIAQNPVTPRDTSRLLVAKRHTYKKMKHTTFKDITDYLLPGDLLVLNDTKVLPARLLGNKKNGGAAVEILFLHEKEKGKQVLTNEWIALVKPGRKLPENSVVLLRDGTELSIGKRLVDGLREVHFNGRVSPVEKIKTLGTMPLPHYICNSDSKPEQYQTIYAKKENENSVAAPTAGLHFTEDLLKRIEDKGINTAYVTLRVGLGTFRPVKEEKLSMHVMHSEFCEISKNTANAILETKQQGGRIIAVGTTVVRTLESFVCHFGTIQKGFLNTDLFITPGYKFKIVDGLITNFHLPKSTLLMLVSAFGGYKTIMGIYDEAITENYRFFSFGDSMFLY